MLESRAMRVASIGILIACVAACTAQDRYDAVYRENVRECDLKVSEAERERCRERLVPATYEEYERQRARALKRGGRRVDERHGGRDGVHWRIPPSWQLEEWRPSQASHRRGTR